jgi:hypothetical protein
MIKLLILPILLIRSQVDASKKTEAAESTPIASCNPTTCGFRGSKYIRGETYHVANNKGNGLIQSGVPCPKNLALQNNGTHVRFPNGRKHTCKKIVASLLHHLGICLRLGYRIYKGGSIQRGVYAQ